MSEIFDSYPQNDDFSSIGHDHSEHLTHLDQMSNLDQTSPDMHLVNSPTDFGMPDHLMHSVSDTVPVVSDGGTFDGSQSWNSESLNQDYGQDYGSASNYDWNHLHQDSYQQDSYQQDSYQPDWTTGDHQADQIGYSQPEFHSQGVVDQGHSWIESHQPYIPSDHSHHLGSHLGWHSQPEPTFGGSNPEPNSTYQLTSGKSFSGLELKGSNDGNFYHWQDHTGEHPIDPQKDVQSVTPDPSTPTSSS